MMDLSQWGLEPDGRHAHLIPFRNNKKGITECQLIIDYKGLVELAYRSGKVVMIHSDVVHSGDIFTFDMGQVTKHVPHYLRTDSAKPATQGDVIAAYCFVEMKGGQKKCEVMSRDEVESIRKRSRAGSSGPWQTDWSEMAKKTVFRRCSKWIPLSAEVRDAFERSHDMTIEATAKRGSISTEDMMARLQAPAHAATDAQDDVTWEDVIKSADSRETLLEVLADIDDSTLDAQTKESLARAAKAKMEAM
jgi:recombination protein RecT